MGGGADETEGCAPAGPSSPARHIGAVGQEGRRVRLAKVGVTRVRHQVPTCGVPCVCWPPTRPPRVKAFVTAALNSVPDLRSEILRMDSA